MIISLIPNHLKQFVVTINCFTISFLAVFGTFGIANADPAYVERRGDFGQGFTFNQRGLCYAVLPDHVVRATPFNVFSGDPPIPATGAFRLRFPDSDLALAIIDGLPIAGCGPTWDSVPNELTRLLRNSGRAELLTHHKNGYIERVPVVITVVQYEHLGINPVEPKMVGRLGKGRSGSLIAVNNIPVGMVIDLPEKDGQFQAELRALRFDAIKDRLRREMAVPQRGRVQTSVSSEAQGTVPFSVRQWSAAPATEEAGPSALGSANPSPYIVPAGATPFVLRLELDVNGGQLPAIKGISIKSDTTDDRFTAPKTVDLYLTRDVDTPLDLNRRSGHFRNGVVSRENAGTLTFRPRKLRYLDIVVLDSWDPFKPIRIDSIRVLQ